MQTLTASFVPSTSHLVGICQGIYRPIIVGEPHLRFPLLARTVASLQQWTAGESADAFSLSVAQAYARMLAESAPELTEILGTGISELT